MSLTLVATPIGHPDDITLRALKVLSEAEVIIGEEFRPLTTLLKRHDIAKPRLEQLNEHSSPEDIESLLKLCQTQRVALVSDCGTPGFCDPGAELVRLCRNQSVEVTSLPGASSLMFLLSLCGQRYKEFVFRGFPPAKTDERKKAMTEYAREKRPQVIMDTPYRMAKLLNELSDTCPDRMAVIGINMTLAEEWVAQDTVKNLATRLPVNKAEFALFLSGCDQFLDTK